MRLLLTFVTLILLLLAARSVAAQTTEFPLSNDPSTVTDCVGDEFHFIITQLDDEADAPAFITVTWSDNTVTQVPLDFTNQSVAHYTDLDHEGLSVLSATAVLPDDWTGNFNLSHIPCPDTPTPTNTPTSTNTPTPTNTPTITTTVTTPPPPPPPTETVPAPPPTLTPTPPVLGPAPQFLPDTGSGHNDNGTATPLLWIGLIGLGMIALSFTLRRRHN